MARRAPLIRSASRRAGFRWLERSVREPGLPGRPRLPRARPIGLAARPALLAYLCLAIRRARAAPDRAAAGWTGPWCSRWPARRARAVATRWRAAGPGRQRPALGRHPGRLAAAG